MTVELKNPSFDVKKEKGIKVEQYQVVRFGIGIPIRTHFLWRN